MTEEEENIIFNRRFKLWLSKICRMYDLEKEEYPESKYEGKALYDYYIKEFT